MTRCLKVSKTIKTFYNKKPMNIRKFIHTYEKSNGFKINKDLRKVLFKLYPNPYITSKNFVDIYGLPHAGKTFLVQLIAAYDLMRADCVAENYKHQSIVCVMSNRTPMNTARQFDLSLQCVFPEVKSKVVGICDNNFTAALGNKPLIFINDCGQVSLQLENGMARRFITYLTLPVSMFSHFITTYDKNDINNHTLIKTDGQYMIINLSHRKKEVTI